MGFFVYMFSKIKIVNCINCTLFTCLNCKNQSSFQHLMWHVSMYRTNQYLWYVNFPSFLSYRQPVFPNQIPWDPSQLAGVSLICCFNCMQLGACNSKLNILSSQRKEWKPMDGFTLSTITQELRNGKTLELKCKLIFKFIWCKILIRKLIHKSCNTGY